MSDERLFARCFTYVLSLAALCAAYVYLAALCRDNTQVKKCAKRRLSDISLNEKYGFPSYSNKVKFLHFWEAIFRKYQQCSISDDYDYDMRVGQFIPLYATAAFIFLSVLYYCSDAWRKIFDRRILTGIKIRQLNAIANNLTRIVMATETESALLNRDINKFLKIVEKQVEYMKQNTSKIS